MKNYRLLLIYGLVAIMAIGCSKENKRNGGEEEEPIDLGDEMSITFDMTVPATGSAATYAIASKDEHFVDNLTAVLFEEVAGEEYYRYHTHATTIENGTTNAKRFRIQVKKSTRGEKYRIVALTNLPADHISDIVAGLVSASKDPKTFKKEDFLKEVNFKSIGKWNTTSSIDFTPLPMWGETPTMQPITTNLTPGQLGTIKLLRSLARVDVGLDMAASGGNLISQGLPNFKLETVKVYNASSSGAIAPLVANLSAVPGELKAENPTLPTGVGVNATAIDYTKAIVADWDKGFIRDIYIAESDVKGAATAQARTCIILKGYYTAQGDPVNITVPTWYRIDFFKKALAGNPVIEYLDILRNCRYHVNITKVSGPGYDTEAEAVNSLPMNLDAEVDVWDESEGMDDVTTDGQYHLVVNKHKFEFYRDGRERILEVFTDHPSGWKVLPADLPTWIHLAPQNSDGQTLPMTSKMDVSITLDPIDPAITDPNYFREGEFTITSGVMKKKIYVKQTNEQELTLEVSPRSITFRKSGSSGKSVTVTSFPAGIPRSVRSTGTIVWAPGEAPEDYDGTTLTSFTFRPEVNTQSNRLESTITITIESNGIVRSEAVTVIQLATDMLFAITNKPMTYPAIGGAALSFTVESDAPWQMSTDGTLDPLGMLSGYDTAEQPATTAPTNFVFTLAGNQTFSTRIAKFLARSSDLDFPVQNIEIVQAAVLPYMTMAAVDLGTNTAPQLKTLSTNTPFWRIKSANTNAGDIFSAVTPALAGAWQTGSNSALAAVNGTAIFTPSQTYVGLGAVGSVANTQIVIESKDTDNTPLKEATVTVQRTVQLSPFTFTSLGAASVGRAGGALAVNVMTNGAWKATPSIGTVSANQAPTAYGNKSTNITIGANTTWSTTTAAVNRTVTVTAAHGPTVSNMPNSGGSKTVTQPGYFISALSRSLPTPVAAGGTSASVTITGAYPAIAVRAAVGATQVSNATPSVAAGESGARSASFTINANLSWSSRSVVCQYQNPRNSNTWTNIDAGVSQAGYAVTAASASPQVTVSAGGTVTIYLTGYRPAIGTRLTLNGSGTTVINVAASTGAQGSANHTLPAHTSYTSTRSIIAQYNHPVSGWVNIASWTQEAANYRIEATGRYVAKRDIEDITWATAMGIPQIYNTIFYPDYAAKYTTGYAVANGGCAAYSEPGYPQGTWRLPTEAEVLIFDKVLPITAAGGFYWINSQYSGSAELAYARWWNEPDPNLVYAYKKTRLSPSPWRSLARCVR